MTPAAWLVAYCGAIAGASLIGGWLPTRVRLTHTRMQLMMSFVAGLMLGVSLLHMLPHAAAELPTLDAAVAWTLAGLLGMFFLIRTFHFHQHGSEEELQDELLATPDAESAKSDADRQAEPPARTDKSPSTAPAAARCSNPSHDHDHDHDHGRGPGHDHAQAPAHASAAHDHSHHHHHGHAHAAEAQTAELLRSGSPYAWLGLALGLGLHTLIDGVALGASVAAEAHGREHGWLFGVGTFLAVVLHKPLDAMSITTLMRTAGWSLRRQQAANLAFALLCPVGAIGFWLGASWTIEAHHQWLGAALAFSAGVFLCISLGDLLPEVHFHSHDRLRLSTALLVGVALAYGVGLLEAPHAHHGRSDSHDHRGGHPHDHQHDRPAAAPAP